MSRHPGGRQMLESNAQAKYALDRDHVIAPARRPGYGIRQRFWNRVLRWTGWKLVGSWPTSDKFIMILAPHTSNWEVPVGLLVGFAGNILGSWPYRFMMKDVWFRWPLGPLMWKLGGLPIDRSRPNEVVGRMAEALAQHERFILAITPEGTRRKTKHWKRGFYFIALATGIPVVPVSFDYARKEVGLGEALYMTGDQEKDLAMFREFFRDVTPRYPDRFGPVTFRNERS